jgi:hypothetical protein
MDAKKIFLIICLSLNISFASAQYIEGKTNSNLAVPFLLLSTDAMSSGRGEAGSALITDGQDIESGMAKLGLAQQRFNINTTYTPWLRKLANDRKLVYLGAFFKPSESLAISASINYLSYGLIDFVDQNNVNLGSVKPAEFYLSVGVAKKFGPDFSIGMKAKLISSNMYNGVSNNLTMQSGTGYAVDISFFRRFPLTGGAEESSLSLAANVLNIGPKISYFNQASQKFYLPTSLKIGTALKIENQSGDTFGLALDINKLLVPTSQTPTDKSVIEAMALSFGEGSAFRDIGFSIGADYTFKNNIAFRTGYNYQGNPRLMGSFFSLGTGFSHKNIAVNISYLIADPQVSFLSNTMRLSLGYSLL